MKLTILDLLMVMALAVVGTQATTIMLDRGRLNSLQFACGAIDQRSGKEALYQDNYAYTFSGQPKWLKVNGAKLEGTVPNGVVGDFPVTVKYRSFDGKRTGSSIYTLSCPAAPGIGIQAGGIFGPLIAAKLLADLVVGQFIKLGLGLFQSAVGKFVVLCPTIPATEALPAKISPINIVTPDAVGGGAISATGGTGGGAAVITAPGYATFTNGRTVTDGNSVVSVGGSVTAVSGSNGLDTTTPTVEPTTVIATGGSATSNGIDGSGSVSGGGVSISGGRGNAGALRNEDSSCSTGTSSGDVQFDGVVTSVGANSIVVDGKTVNFGRCSRRSYGRGKKNFKVNDRITVRGATGADKNIWAKSAVCACA